MPFKTESRFAAYSWLRFVSQVDLKSFSNERDKQTTEFGKCFVRVREVMYAWPVFLRAYKFALQ